MKRHFKLTDDMKERGVVFASTLHVVSPASMRSDNEIVHEVYENDPRKNEIIENLKDVEQFKQWARPGSMTVEGMTVMQTEWY